jgi:hypothetical protein
MNRVAKEENSAPLTKGLVVRAWASIPELGTGLEIRFYEKKFIILV